MNPRVLITRAPDRAADLIRLLAEKGINGLAEPVTRTVYMPLEWPLPDLHDFNWVTFTSVNGVEAFADLLKTRQRTLPLTLQIGVVGPATAEAATNEFRKPDLVTDHTNAEALADALLDGQRQCRLLNILWPGAKKHSAGFVERLQAAHANITPLPVYQTEAVDPAELRPRLEELEPWKAAVFAAPSAVKAFAAAWPDPWDFPAVAIGETTAAALNKLNSVSVYTSPSPRAADLCDLLCSLINH